MKQILIALMLMVAVGVNAQKVYFGSDTDTLVTSSSLDTVDFWLGGTSFATATYFKGDGFLTVQLVSDSLSGGTNATAHLEYFYNNLSSAIPFRAETFTALNGATQQNQMKEETQLGATRVRVRVLAPSSTQNTRLRMNWVYKED
jgi:hypothetical protein